MKIFGINTIDGSVLRQVTEEMKRRGRPTIRAISHDGVLYAIEGTHRLQAALNLGLRPKFIIVADDGTSDDCVIHDFYDIGQTKSVKEIRATYLPQSNIRPVFEFDDDEPDA